MLDCTRCRKLFAGPFTFVLGWRLCAACKAAVLKFLDDTCEPYRGRTAPPPTDPDRGAPASEE